LIKNLTDWCEFHIWIIITLDHLKKSLLYFQTLVKSMIKSWSELYKTVNRLAAMVANAEANIVCEEVCSHVLDHYLEKDNVVSICCLLPMHVYFQQMFVPGFLHIFFHFTK
jgi:hypothetical protein